MINVKKAIISGFGSLAIMLVALYAEVILDFAKSITQ